MHRQIILDTETTGLSPIEGHRIIEIGCLEMINRRETNQRFHCYLNPERSVDSGAYQVHGLSNEFLQDKPLFKEIADEFLKFINGAELIIHNAPFDLSFLNTELNRLGKNYTLIENSCVVIDTLVLARQKHPGQSNSLDALCRRYQVDNSRRDLHGALIDAHLLAQVYRAMTGGQNQLFSQEETLLTEQQTIGISLEVITQKDRQPLLVLEPTIEEQQAHAELMALLNKNSNQESAQ